MIVVVFLTTLFISFIIALSLLRFDAKFLALHLYVVMGFLISTIVAIYYDFKNNLKK